MRPLLLNPVRRAPRRLAQIDTNVLDVTVTVRKNGEFEPVPGVAVEISYPDGTSAVQTTNKGGVVMFSYNLKRGTARVRATSPGGTQSPIQEVELLGAGEQVEIQFPGRPVESHWLPALLAFAGMLWAGLSWGGR